MSQSNWFAVGLIAGVGIFLGWRYAKRTKYSITVPQDEVKIRYNVPKGQAVVPPG